MDPETPPRTLRDYRPQHDEDCEMTDPDKPGQLRYFVTIPESGRERLQREAVCTCGLAALLADSPRDERTMTAQSSASEREAAIEERAECPACKRQIKTMVCLKNHHQPDTEAWCPASGANLAAFRQQAQTPGEQ